MGPVSIWQVEKNINQTKDADLVRRWNDDTKYFSLNKNLQNRLPLDKVLKRGFFRYARGFAPSKEIADKDNITHLTCVEVLSSFKEVTFRFANFTKVDRKKKHEVEFKFASVNPEVTVRSKIQDYRVDLIFDLESSNPLFFKQKWSGRIGVEIFNTHSTSQTKAAELQNDELAIFEISVPEGLRFKRLSEGEFYTEAYYNNYKEILKKYFSKPIECMLISDPSSKEFLEGQNKRLSNEYFKFKIENEALRKKLVEMEGKLNLEQGRLNTDKIFLEKAVKERDYQISNLREELQDLKKKINEFNSGGLGKKFKHLFIKI